MLQAGMSESLSLLLLRIGVILSMLILAFVIDRICRKAVVPTIRKITSKTEFMWDDYLLNDKVLNDFCMLIAPVVVYFLITLALPADLVLDFLLKFCRIYIIVVFMKLLCSIITAMYTLSSEHDKMKNHSMKGFYQMLKLVVICIGTIVIISNLVGKNPGVILTGLGAGTAILMLVFQDTIKGFVAGIQLIANDMLRPGDWICAPKYGADGDVLEVTLTTVKVQNWDKTITTIPPYALVSESFQNWRGMFDSGGRRIKRSIYIDMNSISFCTPEQQKRFGDRGWLKGLEEHDEAIVNLTVLRNYLDIYLRSNKRVNQDMTLMIRQLQPTAQGLPLELYFFSANTAWVAYEHLQADIFEHIIAMLPEFGLKVFQNPAGRDLNGLIARE